MSLVSTGTNKFYRITMFLDVLDQGWSESVDLQPMPLASAMLRAKELCRLRMAMYHAGNARMSFARLTDVETVNWTQSVLDEPLDGLYDPAVGTAEPQFTGGICNNVETGMLIRIEAAAGKRAMRCLRAIPDYLVEGNQIQKRGEASASTINADVPPIYPGLADSISAIGAWQVIKWIRNFWVANCCILKRSGPLFNTTTNTNYYIGSGELINRIMIRGKSVRKTGRPFGMPRGRRAA